MDGPQETLSTPVESISEAAQKMDVSDTTTSEPKLPGSADDTSAEDNDKNRTSTDEEIKASQPLAINATTPVKEKHTSQQLPTTPVKAPTTPAGRRYRILYENLKKHYVAQQMKIAEMENERKVINGNFAIVARNNDLLQEKYDALAEQCDENLLSENVRLNEEIQNLDSERKKITSSYEEIIAGKDKMLANKDAEIERLKSSPPQQNTRMCDTLHRIGSEDSIFRLKQTAKQKKKQASNDELACEFEDCTEKDVDLVKCNMCSKWVCGECNDIPIAKLKPIFNKCRRLYFLCKTCDQKIGTHEIMQAEVSNSGTEMATPGSADLINSLQKMLDKKVTLLEAKIEKSLDKRLGDKLEAVTTLADKIKEQEKKSTDEKKTYAKILDVPKEVRQIIQETRNDDKVNELEQEKRCQNFIIHGAEEIGSNEEEIKENDVQYIADILNHLAIEAQPGSVLRIGKANKDKPRVMKIMMPTKASKDEVISNLRKLKGTEEEFGKISVTDDYTASERKQIQDFVKKAREQGKQDTSQIFKVRGDPKNGLRIVAFKKN